MRKVLLPIALLAGTPVWAASDPAPVPVTVPDLPKEIAKELASGDGKTMASAYVIFETSERPGVDKEYVILRYLGYVPQKQALVFDDKSGKPYDVLTVKDPATGETREVWFDISNYFGKF